MALETDTHRTMNEYITRHNLNGFSLNDYLKSYTDMRDGIQNPVNNQEIWKWLKDGGKWEDVPSWYLSYLRSVNHFLNPLDDSGFSGIWDTGLLSGINAMEWATKEVGTQSPGGCYSWNDARNYYYTALTASNPNTRDNNFAETFRALGQVMHLVQDMSIPEHARNDGHLLLNDYEQWALRKINSATLSEYSDSAVSPKQPVYFIPDGSGHPLTISSLFDTNQYTSDNRNPAVTLRGSIGLSEFTNANFLSPDTILNAGFPYPDWSNMEEYEEADSGEVRVYQRKKTGVGSVLPIEHFVRERIYYDLLPSNMKYLGLRLDDKVYADYGQYLIPRAIGYSSQVLSYFFRGKLEIGLPEDGIYTFMPYESGINTAFGKEFKLTVKNMSDDEMTGGAVYLVLKYKRFDVDPYLAYINTIETPFTYQVISGGSGIAIPKESSVTLRFDLQNNPIPFWITDLTVQVVYYGQMGDEDKAVAVGFKDIREPTPFDWLNLSEACNNYDRNNPVWVDAIDGDPTIENVSTVIPEHFPYYCYAKHDCPMECRTQNSCAPNCSGCPADCCTQTCLASCPANDIYCSLWNIYANDLNQVCVKLSSPLDPKSATPGECSFEPDSVLPAGQILRIYVLSDEKYHAAISYVRLARDSNQCDKFVATDIRNADYDFTAWIYQTDSEPIQSCCPDMDPSCLDEYANGCYMAFYNQYAKVIGKVTSESLLSYRVAPFGNLSCDIGLLPE